MVCFCYYSGHQYHSWPNLDSYGYGTESYVTLSLLSPRVTFQLTRPSYAKINRISDRAQKVVYLLVDGSLNYYFVRLVNQQVSKLGLVKYKPLATFNTRIVILSVAMDVSR